MKLLLDTHLVLWIAGRSDKLSETAKNLVLDSGNLCCFSAVSFWEIMIKLGLNRSDFQVDVNRLREMLLLHGYDELPVSVAHTLELNHLPNFHKDPFDRMLLAQARSEGMKLVTVDAAMIACGDTVIDVRK